MCYKFSFYTGLGVGITDWRLMGTPKWQGDIFTLEELVTISMDSLEFYPGAEGFILWNRFAGMTMQRNRPALAMDCLRK